MSTNKQALREAAEKANELNPAIGLKEFARRTVDYHALANPAIVMALLDELEAAARKNGYLREQSAEWERKAISNFEDCSEMAKRIEDLESQRQLAFMTSNRWADKFRDAGNLNAEQAAIIDKQEKWIKDIEASMIAATGRAEAAEKRNEVLAARVEFLEGANG